MTDGKSTMVAKLSGLTVTIAAAMVLSACNLAPKYQQPQVFTDTSEFKYATQANSDIKTYDLGWQEYFADPQLKQLIALALENNRDLRVAALNVEAVEKQYRIQRADLFPGINASGSMNKSRTAADFRGANSAAVSKQYSVGLGVTSYELDLWGKIRNLSDAALNEYFSTREARDAAQISLIATVAKAYYAERFANEAMKVSQNVLNTREKSYRLADLKYKHGVSNKIDLRTAETLVESAKADYQSQLRAREQARNALVTLIGGNYPSEIAAQASLDKQFAYASLPSGLPSEMLLYRPDIRQAEYKLKAANANIGAARAAFFPSISLTGTIGSGSVQLDNLFTGPNRTWSFMPQISIPLFNWGANKAGLDLTRVRKEISVTQYEQAVQEAFQDVSDVLVANATLKQQYASQLKGTNAELDRNRLMQMRVDHGIADSLTMLDSQRQSYAAQLALLGVQQQWLNSRVDLYKVLGGGLKAYQDGQVKQSPASE